MKSKCEVTWGGVVRIIALATPIAYKTIIKRPHLTPRDQGHTQPTHPKGWDN